MNAPTWMTVFGATCLGLIAGLGFGFAAGMWAMRVTQEMVEEMVKSMLRDLEDLGRRLVDEERDR